MAPTPTKAEQDAEAQARNEGREVREQDDPSAVVGTDADGEGSEGDRSPSEAKPPEPPQRRIAPKTRVDPRDDIVRRIRADRDAEEPQEGLQEAMDAYVPESMRRAPRAQPEPEVEPEAEPQRQQAPPKHVLKVRGKDHELTDEEVFENARKFLAGESYMEDARQTSDRAKALLDDIETRARRVAQPSEPPAPRTTSADPAAPTEDDEPPVDPYVAMVRDVQFGYPDEVGPRLAKIISDAAKREARDMIMAERLQDELTNSQTKLDAFGAKHKDFLADEMLHAAATTRVFSIMRRELQDVGVDKDQLAGMNNDQIGGLHLRFRAGRQRVTQDVGEIFERARDEVEQRFGGAAPRREQPDPAAAEEPKPASQQQNGKQPAVSVDRSQRRLLIPQQPTRSPARQPVATPERPTQQDPSDVIRKMAEQRRPVAHNAR